MKKLNYVLMRSFKSLSKPKIESPQPRNEKILNQARNSLPRLRSYFIFWKLLCGNLVERMFVVSASQWGVQRTEKKEWKAQTPRHFLPQKNILIPLRPTLLLLILLLLFLIYHSERRRRDAHQSLHQDCKARVCR